MALLTLLIKHIFKSLKGLLSNLIEIKFFSYLLEIHGKKNIQHRLFEDIPSYTFDTLTKLNHKKDNLYFILGSDTAMNIRTWNNYEKLSELTNFLIALRKEDSVNNLNENFPFDYELIDGEKLDLSSTSLRNKLKDNLFNEQEISLKIIQYIKKNSLY